jgi:hypothetical protein
MFVEGGIAEECVAERTTIGMADGHIEEEYKNGRPTGRFDYRPNT